MPVSDLPPAAAPLLQWQPVNVSPSSQSPVDFNVDLLQPEHHTNSTDQLLWRPVLLNPTSPNPVWTPQDSRTNSSQRSSTIQVPRSAAEAEERRQYLLPPRDSYVPLLRLGQLPAAAFLQDGGGTLNFQQVSPFNGGAAGGTGNQNYGFRADLAVNNQILISGFYSYADDPLFSRITVRTKQPSNLWTVAGVALRAQLWGRQQLALAAEASAEMFTVGSGGCDAAGCKTTSDNIFNLAGQRVQSRNVISALTLPLSWNPTSRWQLVFTPGVSFLPSTQGISQGGAGKFFGTNIFFGAGSSYRVGDQLNLFSSVLIPVGPGCNAFNGSLDYYRVPILSIGANYAVNPRIGLEASVTNGYGLTPATAILALPSAPTQPMLSARFAWTPTAPDSPKVAFTSRQRSLAMGGLTVSTALLPPDRTTSMWLDIDSSGNLLGSANYSVSNDFQFEMSGGTYGNAAGSDVGVSGVARQFLDTYLGQGNRTLRFGGKAMVFRPNKGVPIWAAGRITVGRNFNLNSYQGYLFFESVNTWEASRWLAFNVNPKLSWTGLGTPWGVGVSANIQLGRDFQLIPEINAIATNYGGRNGSNATLAIRWFASPTTALDVYTSNSIGLLDMGQLLAASQLRIGAKLTVQF